MNPNKSMDKKSKASIVILMVLTIIITSGVAFSFSVLVLQFILLCITMPLILKKSRKVAKIYLLIYLVSLIFVFLVHFAYQIHFDLPYYNGGSDDLNFEKYALALADEGILTPVDALNSGLLGVHTGSSFYTLFISYLYRFANLFGKYSTFLPKITNVYFFIYLIMVFEYLLQKYGGFSEERCNKTILIVGLFPNLLYVNAHVFRDTMNLLQVLLIIFVLDQILYKKKPFKKLINLFLLIMLVYITYYTRANSLVFAAALGILVIGERFNIKKIYIVLISVPIVITSGVLETIGLFKYIEYYSVYNASIVSEGFSSYVFNQPIMPFGILFRSLFAFAVPFPNFILLFREPSKFLLDIITFIIYVGVIIQLLFAPFVLKRILKMDWLATSFLVVFLSVIVTTFTFRHVIFYYPLMAALAIDGYMSMNKKSRSNMLLISVLGGLSLTLIYIALKLL